LIAAGHLPSGTVDERSILDVQPGDLGAHAQCHFFAGIGGWAHALHEAGWPEGRPVWTGSCPCQPFSVAGKGAGFADARHLWPIWFELIRECRPPTIFGEQVEGPAGRAWLDLVFSDLEAIGYACGAAVLPVAGVGAPHARHRLYFMAHAERSGRTRRTSEENRGQEVEPDRHSATGLLGDACISGGRRNAGAVSGPQAQGCSSGIAARHLADEPVPAGSTCGFWADVEWISCRDGKARAAQPGAFPLAHGVPGRVGRLRAYGNAICPPVAVAFIRAAMVSLHVGST
jgi:DNA (cytosine-5)-methyltransferase 1